MVFALSEDVHLAGGKANVQEDGKAMPSRRSAGKSTLRATPRQHLQQICHLLQASRPQNPALLLQNEGPVPRGEVKRCQVVFLQVEAASSPLGILEVVMPTQTWNDHRWQRDKTSFPTPGPQHPLP